MNTESWQNYTCYIDSCQEKNCCLLSSTPAQLSFFLLFSTIFFSIFLPSLQHESLSISSKSISFVISTIYAGISVIYHFLLLSSLPHFQQTPRERINNVDTFSISFVDFLPPRPPSTPAPVTHILSRLVLNIPVHTHESESWPWVTTCYREHKKCIIT